MAAIGRRVADLHPPLGEQASNEAKRQGSDLDSVRRAEIGPHGVNDLPETHMIRVTLFDKILQDIIWRHKCRL